MSIHRPAASRIDEVVEIGVRFFGKKEKKARGSLKANGAVPQTTIPCSHNTGVLKVIFRQSEARRLESRVFAYLLAVRGATPERPASNLAAHAGQITTCTASRFGHEDPRCRHES